MLLTLREKNVQFPVAKHSCFAIEILYFKLLTKCFVETPLLAFVLESVVTSVATS